MGRQIALALACAAAVAGYAPTNVKELVELKNAKTTVVDGRYRAVHKTIATSGSPCFDSKYETKRERRIRTGATIAMAILGGLGGAIAVASRRTHVESTLDETKKQGTTGVFVTSTGPTFYGLHVIAADANTKTSVTTYTFAKKAIETDHKMVLDWLKDPTACPIKSRRIVRGADGTLTVVEPPEDKPKNTEPGPPGQTSAVMSSLQ